jgi:hypothetical protein
MGDEMTGPGPLDRVRSVLVATLAAALEPAERTVVLEDTAQPLYLEGYHKPASTHPDQPVYDAIDDILSNGRTSRLYRALVRDKKLAIDVQSFSGFPGEKYPNLWAAFVVPAFGVTNQQVQAALREEIERLKREDVTDEELAKFKTRAKKTSIGKGHDASVGSVQSFQCGFNHTLRSTAPALLLEKQYCSFHGPPDERSRLSEMFNVSATRPAKIAMFRQ